MPSRQKDGLHLGGQQPPAFYRVEIQDDGAAEVELDAASIHLRNCLELREKYQAQVKRNGSPPAGAARPVSASAVYYMENGVVKCPALPGDPPPDYNTYASDIRTIYAAVNDGPTNSMCRNRLKILEEKYAIFCTLNATLEDEQCPAKKGGGVFAPCVKVDNSVKLNTSVHALDVVDFVKTVAVADMDMTIQPDTPPTPAKFPGPAVLEASMSDGRMPSPTMEFDHHARTLRQMLSEHSIGDVAELTVEGLGLHPPAAKCFHRFDVFSAEHNTGGEASAALLSMLLKREGPYLHKLIQPMLSASAGDFPAKRVAHEYKLTLFGSEREEWAQLAGWVLDHGIGAHDNVRFMIQIPRQKAARRHRRYQRLACLQEQLDNIFLPLWEATMDPSASPEAATIAMLLDRVGAFTVEGDEYKRHKPVPPERDPKDVPWPDDVHDVVFCYYLWANITTLNRARRARGLEALAFRPHCGEQGRLDALVSGFLLAETIHHGALTMGSSQVLQYLFYLSQTGIVFSPLAANGIGKLPYENNPFLKFQRMGMRVSLGTEDPLHYHHSRDPILEEYGTASKMYKLRPVDVTEVARNSVINSSFPMAVKCEWLGDDWDCGSGGCAGNRQDLCFVPDVRLQFRYDTLAHERGVLQEAMLPRGRSFLLRPSSRAGSPTSTELGRRSSTVSCGGKIVSDIEVDFVRIQIISPHTRAPSALGAPTSKDAHAATRFAEALALRKKYIAGRTVERDTFINLGADGADDTDEFKECNASQDYECAAKAGVFRYKPKSRNADVYEPADLPSLAEFKKDATMIHDIVDDIAVKAYAHKRLQVLEHKYRLHLALNGTLEDQKDMGSGTARDFYQANKVDTHIHAAAGMTARQLLDFIQDKAVHSMDDVVEIEKASKKPTTLRQLLKRLQIDPEKLSVDLLDVQADATLFERFDNFNNKYNPLGNPDLRNLLLKTDNYMGGRYFAEIVKSTFAQFVRDRFTYVEMRLSIYGRKPDEWSKLATWFDTHGMACSHNKWMIQVPRIYPIFRKIGLVKSFQDILTNVFKPLWDVSIDPASDPKLHHFLKHVSGFDSVDNESAPDAPFDLVPPAEWTSQENPPYGYWMYFMWANIHSLNAFRAMKGLSTFAFRPHCGESGSIEHLMHSHLVAHQINHGVNLRHDPVLEYLFYLTQIGIAVSPLSNNALFVGLNDNPFPHFFKRGLNVSLSTDDPLQFHYTQEPLIEEYCVASKVWGLTNNDMCEIARNSVRQSGFDVEKKAELLGDRYLLNSSSGNAAGKTQLSDVRVAYRFEVYHSEIDTMEDAVQMPIFDDLRCFASIDEEAEWLRARAAKRDPPSRRGTLADPDGDGDGYHVGGGWDNVHVRTKVLEMENAKLRDEVHRLREGGGSGAASSTSAPLDVDALAAVLKSTLAPLASRIERLESQRAAEAPFKPARKRADDAKQKRQLDAAAVQDMLEAATSPLLHKLAALERTAQ